MRSIDISFYDLNDTRKRLAEQNAHAWYFMQNSWIEIQEIAIFFKYKSITDSRVHGQYTKINKMNQE